MVTAGGARSPCCQGSRIRRADRLVGDHPHVPRRNQTWRSYCLTTFRVVTVACAVLGLTACEFFRDDVSRAQRNCERVTTQAGEPGVDPVKHCQLVRKACDMDREGAACQALLERYL